MQAGCKCLLVVQSVQRNGINLMDAAMARVDRHAVDRRFSIPRAKTAQLARGLERRFLRLAKRLPDS